MSPVVLILPAVALLIGPRLWVEHVRKRYHRQQRDEWKTGGEFSRALLDRHHLEAVAVERTDIGDHYDPKQKVVRLRGENFDRRTLAALVTAAHEVGHALQDASGYPPFRWRGSVVKLARVTAQVGGVLLLATPAAALISRHPVPPAVVGGTALAVLGTGVAAQLVALPTEWDASFKRALPMLEDESLSTSELEGARRMLLACSFTYIAASMAAVLQLWPLLPARPLALQAIPPCAGPEAPAAARLTASSHRGQARKREQSTVRALVRLLAKPLIRARYLATGATAAIAGSAPTRLRPSPACGPKR